MRNFFLINFTYLYDEAKLQMQNSKQILHLIYCIEKILLKLVNLNLNFGILFLWNEDSYEQEEIKKDYFIQKSFKIIVFNHLKKNLHNLKKFF
jgi:hypothetical protein